MVSVSDGDTITVLDDATTQHKICFAGIDAPEKGQAFGERSKQSLSAPPAIGACGNAFCGATFATAGDLVAAENALSGASFGVIPLPGLATGRYAAEQQLGIAHML